MTMRIVFAILCACFSALSQDPTELFSKAPPVIDEILRSRISEFYQAHKDGRFRVAEKLVAEDSKDIFFEADKRRCREFKIARITYEEQFTKAKVVVNCDTEILMPPRGVMRVTMPLASNWRSENGEWLWFVVPRPRETPFGDMKPGEGGETQIPKGPSVEDIRRMVSVSKTEIPLSLARASEQEVTVTSTLNGDVQLQVTPPAAKDLTASIDRKEINGKGTAKLSIQYTPDPSKPRAPGSEENVYVTVMPINQRIRVKLSFIN